MGAFGLQMNGACGKWAVFGANGKAPAADRQMLVANQMVLGSNGGILVADGVLLSYACGI
jgi:hypothetical protein